MTRTLLAELRAAITDGSVIDDADVMRTYQADKAGICAYGLPVAVVRPRSTEEVSAVVRVAAKHGVPVVPQGARSGLAGGANAIEGAIALSMTAMDRILSIDTVNRTVVVQPGVINAALSRAVAEQGLKYPPDPSSWEMCTIGGNISTNAGGMCCVKYGVTTEYVLGLEVVLADGEVLRCGRRTPKGVAGYDLTRLFVGSEGTLGVVTEITLALRPAFEDALTMVAVFPSTAAASAAVAAICSPGTGVAGGLPSMLELIDQTELRAIEKYRPMGLPTDAKAVLLAAADSGPRAVADLELIAELCRRAGADEVHVATDATEAEGLLEARRFALPALERLAVDMFPEGNGTIIIDDVAVPRSRLAEMLDGIEKVASDNGVIVGVVGHAGDGNLHPNIVVDRADPSSLERSMVVFDAIMELGLSLGGTCTGEHGVGLLKRDWLAQEIGPVGLRVHRAIKAALDPQNLLNPGKVV